MSDVTDWSIQFYENGEPVNKWTGFLTAAEARRCIQDMDYAIPLDWTYEVILEEEPYMSALDAIGVL